MLKLLWNRIRRYLAMVRRMPEVTRLDGTKTALRRIPKNGGTRSCPSILYLDEQIVDIGVLYRSTDEAATWVRLTGATGTPNAIDKGGRNPYTFEFEFEFRLRGSECRTKNC